MAGVSQREFARRKEWNPGYVNKLIKRGVITLDAEGKIDPAAADAAIAALRDRLLNLPDRLAPILAAETDGGRVHDMISTEIKAVLRELALGETEPARQ